VLLGLVGCAQQATIEPRQDPLIGQIIEARTQQPIEFETLVERAAQSDVVYLGERHDNAEHHRIQLRIIQALVDRGQQPAIGFEFFDSGQSGVLMQYVSGKRSIMQLNHSGKKQITPEQWLRRELGWQQREDKDWQYYFQLIELAKQHQLPVFGADLPAGIKLRLSRSELDSLNPVEQQQLALLPLQEGDYKRFMYQRFKDGHCGWGQEPLLSWLYRTWLERNYRMASSITAMAKGQQNGPVVMIIGAGHTEHGLGVVEQVRLQQPQLTQLNLALQEIYRQPAELADYLYGDTAPEQDLGARYQLLWFTQRQDYKDLCAIFKQPAN
jgi:uncharacterized iron-regulated protein